jgi:sugar lactone lactonase YvrE
VDSAGNVYIADTGNQMIKEWQVASSTVITNVSSGLSWPGGVAVDTAGNVYITDTSHCAIKEWLAASGGLSTLVSMGLYCPNSVAVDGAGNVYIADTWNNAIKEWMAVNGAVTNLVTSGLNTPEGVAVDGAGNIYIADSGNYVIKKWIAASNTVHTLVSSGLSNPLGVAVDSAGNVYIADSGNSAIEELPRAFVDPTARLEGNAAGADSLGLVLPTTANLQPPFAPTSDSTWLTITGVTNGVVSFGFTATTTNRTGNITVLGVSVPVVQMVPPQLFAPGMGTNGFQFSFSNGTPGASYLLVSATNLTVPLSNWAVVAASNNLPAGLIQFTAPLGTNAPQSFYRVRTQ